MDNNGFSDFFLLGYHSCLNRSCFGGYFKIITTRRHVQNSYRQQYGDNSAKEFTAASRKFTAKSANDFFYPGLHGIMV
jgi:hypothetical protein